MTKLSIQLNKEYKSFPDGFETSFDGDLIVLSGVNGSGKSQLLDILTQRETPNSRNIIPATITLNGVSIIHSDISRRTFKDNINIPEFTHAGTESLRMHQGQAWNAYSSYLLDFNNENLWDFKESCEKVKKILIEKFGEQKFNNKQITQPEINDALPVNFVWKSKDIFTNFIGESFFNYASDVYDGCAKAGLTTEKFDSSTLPTSPWAQLNELFSTFGFEYRFKDNYTVEKFKLNEQPCLYQVISSGVINEKQARKLTDLSDGEKAIISLSFASLSGVKQENKKILLLDEFDANFNPSLTEIFYKILEKYFTSEGIPVVIATHSPTTISLAPNITSFYEVFKQNATLSNRILPVQKSNYAELQVANKEFYTKISNQNSRISELEEENRHTKEVYESLEQKIGKGTNALIITEGKTDIQHIKKAKEKLNIKDCDIDCHEIPGNFGDSKLKLLLEQISQLEQPRKIIGIFDRDVKKIILDIEEDNQKYKDYGNNVYAFCVPVPENRADYTNISIEFYYSDDELKKEQDGKCLYFDNEINFDSKRKPISAMNSPHKNLDKKIWCENIGDLDWIHSKSVFAGLVETNEEFTSDFDFSKFNLIFNKIKEILENNNNEAQN